MWERYVNERIDSYANILKWRSLHFEFVQKNLEPFVYWNKITDSEQVDDQILNFL